jgi:hypothetical protein
MMWTGMLELAGLMPPGPYNKSTLDAATQVARDTVRVTQATREALADPARRERLHERIAYFVGLSDELLGRWANVMLSADAYAEIIDRHVELVGDLAWMGSLFDHLKPRDHAARARIWSHPAFQIEGELSDDQLASRIVASTQLAAELDSATLEVALRLVPVVWWANRLGSRDATMNARPEPSLAPGPMR